MNEQLSKLKEKKIELAQLQSELELVHEQEERRLRAKEYFALDEEERKRLEKLSSLLKSKKRTSVKKEGNKSEEELLEKRKADELMARLEGEAQREDQVRTEKILAEKEQRRIEILNEETRTHALRQIELLRNGKEAFRTGNLDGAEDALDKSYELDVKLDDELVQFLEGNENIRKDVRGLCREYSVMRTDLAKMLRYFFDHDPNAQFEPEPIENLEWQEQQGAGQVNQKQIKPEEKTETPTRPKPEVAKVSKEGEEKRTHAEIKISKEIEVELGKQIKDYSEEELPRHLEWINTQLKWPSIKKFKFLEMALGSRRITVESRIKLNQEKNERLGRISNLNNEKERNVIKREAEDNKNIRKQKIEAMKRLEEAIATAQRILNNNSIRRESLLRELEEIRREG